MLWWLAWALAFESADCNIALDVPGEAVPVAVPASPSVRGAWGWTFPGAGADGVLSASCTLLPDVPEPRGARELLSINAGQLAGALGATVVSRVDDDWRGHPSVVVELRAPAFQVKARYAVVGSRLVNVMYQTGPTGVLPADPFAGLRVLRELGELPPSQRPVTFAAWTAPDGAVTAEAPGVENALQVLPSDLGGRSLPFQVVSWRAPGHGTFGVRWTELPPGVDPTLDELVAMQAGPMKLAAQGSAPVGGAGREVWGVMGAMADRGVWLARFRVLRAGRRVVIAVAHGREGELSEPDVRRFLDSVALR